VYRFTSKIFSQQSVHTFLLITLSTLSLYLLVSSLQLAEHFFTWSTRHEAWPIEELLLILLALAVTLGVTYAKRARALNEEIARRLRLEATLAFQDEHDALTKLPNRKLFLAEANTLLNQRAHTQTDTVVLALDLDDFRIINDSKGYEAGDQLLLTVARRLQHRFAQQAFIARLGGDEFLLLLKEQQNVQQVNQLIQQIQALLQEPIRIGSCDMVVTTSIGAAFATGINGKAEELLCNADAALSRAKSRGKSAYAFFENAMNVAARAYLALESELRQAVQQQQFRVYYQPIFHLPSNRVVGLEALVRWQHPEKGILTPDYFLDVAESSGMMTEIGQFVFDEACRQVGQWQQCFACQQTLYLSINLSADQFQHPTFIEQATELIQQTAFPADQLHLEILEGIAMQHTEAAIATMHQLQRLGIHIALDDFGTGYSSLAYLRHFPINGLKLDRSFVVALEAQTKNLTILQGIIGLTQALGLELIAEGIETASQLSTLNALGCTYGQGYYFAKPMPAEAMRPFLIEQGFGEPSSLSR